MDHAARVRIADRITHLGKSWHECEALLEAAAILQRVGHRATRDQPLRGVKRSIGASADLEEGSDSRMFELSGDPRLANEARFKWRQRGRIRRSLLAGMQLLERDFAAKVRVPCDRDHALAASRQLTNELI